MDKIVDIRKRIEGRKQKEQLKQYSGKVETIQKVVQCSSCHFRCAMCGIHTEMTDSSNDSDSSSLDLTLCESCRSEFDDFLSVSRGEKRSNVFWHNNEWFEMWSAWLDYRQAITDFMDSPEFELLVEELNT